MRIINRATPLTQHQHNRIRRIVASVQFLKYTELICDDDDDFMDHENWRPIAANRLKNLRRKHPEILRKELTKIRRKMDRNPHRFINKYRTKYSRNFQRNF